MDATKRLATTTYRHFMHDSMRRNSSLLIISQAVLAGSLFLFWVISAHLFPVTTVGLATSFISFGVLVSTFTNLGLPNTVIRFLPTSKRRAGLFTASVILVAISSLIGGVVGLVLIEHLIPKLSFIHSSLFLSIALLLLVSGTAVSALLDGTLMAFRKGEYVLIKAMITNLPRIFLPFFVIGAGLKGITGVYVVTLIIGILINFVTIFSKLLRSERLEPTLAEVTKYRTYAFSNYFGGMFGVLPSTVVPIIVLSRLGAAPAAYFYMPMQMAFFLSVVCNAISQALIAETSQTNNEKKHIVYFKKALRHQYQVLIPTIALLCLAGWPILRIYGKDYAAHGFIPLLILAGSGLIVGINWLGDTWLNVKKRSRDYFLMNAFNSLAVVGFVYAFSSHGLVAVAFGWLVGQLVSATVYLVVFARSHLLSFVGFRTSS